jgi:3'-5' exonuclease
MDYRNFVYFDIETAGKYPDLDTLKENDIRGYDLFMRKIERKSEQFTDWKIDPNIVYKTKVSLMPEFGVIVCVSMAIIQDDDSIKKQSVCEFDEKVLINKVHKVFDKISNSTTLGLCGYYIKGFDIPWLNRKFLQHGLNIPKVFKNFGVKPWEMNVADLSEVWKSYSTLEHVSFDEMLYALNLESPKSLMAGKDVHRYFWELKDKEKIKEYCEADVRSCVEAGMRILPLV